MRRANVGSGAQHAGNPQRGNYGVWRDRLHHVPTRRIRSVKKVDTAEVTRATTAPPRWRKIDTSTAELPAWAVRQRRRCGAVEGAWPRDRASTKIYAGALPPRLVWFVTTLPWSQTILWVFKAIKSKHAEQGA